MTEAAGGLGLRGCVEDLSHCTDWELDDRLGIARKGPGRWCTARRSCTGQVGDGRGTNARARDGILRSALVWTVLVRMMQSLVGLV